MSVDHDLEDSQLGKQIQMLESAGYQKSDDQDDLGTQEYHLGVAGNRKMLSLGSGRSGDSGCYMVFYYTIDSEELIEHGCFSTEE